MICRKCSCELPEGANFCFMCGAKQLAAPHRRLRPNGAGSAYKRGKTWTAVVVVAWKDMLDNNGEPIKDKRGYIKQLPVKRTKGGFKTKREALEYCAKLKETASPKRQKGITFQKLYTQWIKRHENRVTKDTLNCYKAAYKYYKDIYYMVFADLSTQDWQLCVDDCPQGKRTKQNMKALGTLLYGYAQEIRVTKDDFAKHIYIPHMETESRNAFKREEIQIILDAANSSVPYADTVAVLIFTGFRPSALLQLQSDDYDDKNKVLTGGIKTDAGKNRIVTLPPVIQGFVAKCAKNAAPFLFPKKDGSQMDDKYFREECFYPLLRDLNIQPIPDPANGVKPTYTPYSCRHTFATLMKNVSGSDKDKAALMGHTSFEMTFHYQHEDIDSLKSITDNLWPTKKDD